MNYIRHKIGVHPLLKCRICRETATQSFKRGPVDTGIKHPEYCETYAFNNGMCPRCDRENDLKLMFASMDAYAKKNGEKALATRMGLK